MGGKVDFAMRMLDYSVRLSARMAPEGRRLVQHVIVLGEGNVEEGLEEEGLSFSYNVHYVRHKPVEPLLADPFLSPYFGE